jgi:hypothetical protein
MPRRPRPPKAVLKQRERELPAEEQAALQAAHQQFVEQTFLSGVGVFEKRVDAFLKQFGKMDRERARAIVRECCDRYARETEEIRAGKLEKFVRDGADAESRAFAIALNATRTVFVRGLKGQIVQHEVPDYRTRLRALQVKVELSEKVCHALGLDEPAPVEVNHHHYDENLVRAAQETANEEFQSMMEDEKRRKLPPRVEMVGEDDDHGTRH